MWADEEKVQQPASYLRGILELDGKVASAELAITACGVYRCFVNGRPVTDQVFTPGFTYYRRRLQYQTYDVTGLVAGGTNVVGVVLGDGWYRGKIGAFSRRNHYGTKTKVAAVLTVTLADGSVAQLTTGPDWRATQEGPIRMSDWKDGEVYDARMEIDGWAEPDSDDRAEPGRADHREYALEPEGQLPRHSHRLPHARACRTRSTGSSETWRS